jgi:SEC-C motif
VPATGRNDPCPCGSGRKTKRCCGQQRGPSEDQLARAHLAALARQAIPDLAGLSDHALDRLWEGLMDLPSVDLSLLVALPKLIGPDLQRLRESIEHDDPDWGWDALTAVHQQIDTPQQRARLADARSSHSAASGASTAGKPTTHSLTSAPAPPASSPPASSKPSPSRSASTAPPPASTSPPDHHHLSGASSLEAAAGPRPGERGRQAAATTSARSSTSSPLADSRSASTLTVSPGTNRPSRIASARRSTSRFWITRLSGRAP